MSGSVWQIGMTVGHVPCTMTVVPWQQARQILYPTSRRLGQKIQFHKDMVWELNEYYGCLIGEQRIRILNSQKLVGSFLLLKASFTALKPSTLPLTLLFVVLIYLYYTLCDLLSLIKLWVNSLIHFTFIISWPKNCINKPEKLL